MTDAVEPKVVVVKSSDPFVGLTGLSQLTGEQVAVSQYPLARHAIEFVDSVYPVSHVTDAVDPKVVVVKSSDPWAGLTRPPQFTGVQVTSCQLPFD